MARDLVVVAIHLVALLSIVAFALNVDHILISIALILPILGTAFFGALRVAKIVAVLRGRDFVLDSDPDRR
jgi:hypothetical protein